MTRKRTAVPESAWCNLVGLAAFGLYKRMQAVMAEGQPYGHLTTAAGTALTTNDLARLVGESPAVVRKLVDRLVQVHAIEDTGAVFTDPDMIHQKDVSVKRSLAGSRGASRTNSRTQAGLFDAANGPDAAPFAAANGQDAAATSPASGGQGPGSHAPGKALTGDTVTSASSAAATSSTRVAWEPDEPGSALLAVLESDTDRWLLRYLLERVRFAPAWVAEMAMALTPENMHGKQATPAQLSLAIRHYVGNGECEPPKEPSMLYFTAYLRKALQDKLSPTAPLKFGRAPSPGRPTAEYDGSRNLDAAAALEAD